MINTSHVVVESDFHQAYHEARCADLCLDPTHLNRKIWEYVTIAQVFYERCSIVAPALGFGVGREPIPAYLAHFGNHVVATDQPISNESVLADWASTGQHASGIEHLPRLAPEFAPNFDSLVRFEPVDMNHIPEWFMQGGFGFTWSAGSFEHIGSIDAGLDFFCNQMRALRPGGVACHTTEYNFASDTDTLEARNVVLYRRSDLEQLATRLQDQGDVLLPLDFSLGSTDADLTTDYEPYSGSNHLRVGVCSGAYQTTSIVLIAIRGGA